MSEQMPPVVDGPQAPKKSNTPIIVAIIVVILLCCCCIALAGAWQFGDVFMNSMNF
jgi:hypothetical protein